MNEKKRSGPRDGGLTKEQWQAINKLAQEVGKATEENVTALHDMRKHHRRRRGGYDTDPLH
jgi:hypothetical protein